VLADFSDQTFYFRRFGDIGWHRDSFAREWKCVERGASLFACCGFARCDEDLRAASLDETMVGKLGRVCHALFAMNIPRGSVEA
jgi:hypothetical protein